MTAPVLPVREVRARLDRKSHAWVPCRDDDPRGSMVMHVDAEGRAVLSVYRGSPFDPSGLELVGWKLAAESPQHDPALFKEWVQNHPRLESTK